MLSRTTLLCMVCSVLAGLLSPSVTLSQDTGGLVDDFDSGNFDDRWWFYEDGSAFTCVLDEPGYNSQGALRLSFNTGAGSYPGCGRDVAGNANWTDADGLYFFWRSDRSGLNVTAVLNIADPTQTNPDAGGLTPFEARLQAPGDAWAKVVLPWDAFAKADWVGGSGVTQLDPAQIVEVSFVVNESQAGSMWIDNLGLMVGDTAPYSTVFDKFALWTGPTQLRGINTWQRIVVPAVDGDEFLGSGHVGPPYTQEDFDRLAALGANYVNISGPGLFTETPPYVLDEDVQADLDNMLTMIANADMFAVITFRTGPGRSDWTFYDDVVEAQDNPALVVENVWTDQGAQDAWVEMWRYTAARYGGNPIVVGYDLMCEPNAAGRLLDIYDPDEFYPAYADTLYDWNQFYPRIVTAIRDVDTNTPILVSGMGWGAVRWLPYLKPVDDPRVVYTVHQYEPQDEYTHQTLPITNTYPGTIDLNYDGSLDTFDRTWLEGYLATIDDFKAEHGGVPVAVNEYGLMRWVPNAADFMGDEMTWFEQHGLNHAFWMWNPSWPPHNAENDDFDFWHGGDPGNHTSVTTNDVIEVILANWSLNVRRPSNSGD